MTSPAGLARFFFPIGIFFLVMTGIPAIIIFGLHEPGTPWYVYLGMAFGPTIALSATIWTQLIIRRERIANYDIEGVTLSQKGIRFRRKWWVPYGSYSGVALREQVIDTRYDSTTFQVVELVHKQPANNAMLFVGRDRSAAHEALKIYAERLGLSVISADKPSKTVKQGQLFV